MATTFIEDTAPWENYLMHKRLSRARKALLNMSERAKDDIILAACHIASVDGDCDNSHAKLRELRDLLDFYGIVEGIALWKGYVIIAPNQRRKLS